jgi:hypothetical protein
MKLHTNPNMWWRVTCEFCPWSESRLDRGGVLALGYNHAAEIHPEQYGFRVQGFLPRNDDKGDFIENLVGEFLAGLEKLGDLTGTDPEVLDDLRRAKDSLERVEVALMEPEE